MGLALPVWVQVGFTLPDRLPEGELLDADDGRLLLEGNALLEETEVLDWAVLLERIELVDGAMVLEDDVALVALPEELEGTTLLLEGSPLPEGSGLVDGSAILELEGTTLLV